MKKLFLLVIAAAGLYILYWGCFILIQSRHALSWPQTKGDVVATSLTVHYLPKFIDRRADPLRWYGTEVRYEYTVNGGRYSSDRLSFQNGDTRDPKEALGVMNKYRRLHKVMVYYDPKNPQEAVLEPRDVGGVYIPLLIGVLLAFWGLSGFFSESLTASGDIDRYLRQGQIYQNEGNLDEALWQYSQVIRINPYHASGYSGRGDIYLRQENWDQAIVNFSRAIEIDPNNAVVYFALGNAYLGKKQYAEAWDNVNMAAAKGFNVRPGILENIKKQL